MVQLKFDLTLKCFAGPLKAVLTPEWHLRIDLDRLTVLLPSCWPKL